MHVIECRAAGRRDEEHVGEDQLGAAKIRLLGTENTIFDAKRLMAAVYRPYDATGVKLLIMATVEGQ